MHTKSQTLLEVHIRITGGFILFVRRSRTDCEAIGGVRGTFGPRYEK